MFGERFEIVYLEREVRNIETTLTGPLSSNLQISISSSLPGALKKTSSEPRGDFERWVSFRPSTSL